MSTMHGIIEFILQISVIKTIYFNLHYFGLKGLLHRYAIISRKTSLKKLNGKVILYAPRKHCLRIGFGHNELLDYKYERTIIFNEGTIIIRGFANLNQGFRLYNRGTIDFGNSFVVTGNSSVICMKYIQFGEDCLISWGVSIMDTDFHTIVSLNDGKIINENKEIVIGSHCWICAYVTVLKGTTIPNNCIIGSGSIVSKNFSNSNSIIIDNKIVRENINWNH